MKGLAFQDKISNHHQVGGIELSILDDGNGRGSRVAWFNTGSGLRFKLVLDRAMDIADAFYNEYSLAWISHLGVSKPNPTTDNATNWLKSFGGGLLTTCGLTQTGGEINDFAEGRGVHDQISMCPAIIESIIQPDLRKGNMHMSITGRMIQTSLFGPSLELKRTISAELGSSVIGIKDEVINVGNSNAPHMLLYHINFGWPLLDEGTELIWDGAVTSRGGKMDNKIFNSDCNYKKCVSPSNEYSGEESAVGFVDIAANDKGLCECGVNNPELGLKVLLRYTKENFPWMANWQHYGKNEYVTALEPCTAPPLGQVGAKKENLLIQIRPQETRTYNIEIEIINNHLK